jgi:hypothetical protein
MMVEINDRKLYTLPEAVDILFNGLSPLIPLPTTAGRYVLVVTVVDDEPTYAWEVEE